MTDLFVEAIAVVGPGITDWPSAIGVFRDPSTYRAGAPLPDVTTAIPPNERRRTTPMIRLTLEVLAQLAKQSRLDLSQVASVFATSWGDLQVIENMMSALVAPGIPVSPVQFHNMVHNAPAGYWSIGVRAQRSSTSLTADEGTFAAGLIDALAWVKSRKESVLLVCYDCPGPEIYDRYQPIEAPFAMAMTLTAVATGESCCGLRLRIDEERPETTLSVPELERLRRGNPAARALTLLETIATRAERQVVLTLHPGATTLAVDLVPLH